MPWSSPGARVRHVEPVVAVGAGDEVVSLVVAALALLRSDAAGDRDVGRSPAGTPDVADAAGVGQVLAVVAAGADGHRVLRHADTSGRVPG